jgi:Chondroitinase B
MTAEDPARWWVRWSSVGLLATAWVGSCHDVATLPILGRAYYVSPAGNDGNPGTQDAPFGTISHGLDVVAPGDTIVVRDGVYAEALTPHTSGTSGAPITLRAEHDGQAVVDGLGVRRPLVVQGVSHTAYEGLVFVNSNHSVVMVITSDQTPTGVPSTHNVFRRVSAYNVFGTGNDHIIEVDWSGDNLFEDCVAAGRGRTTIANFGSVGNTFRRCWMRGDEGTEPILRHVGRDPTCSGCGSAPPYQESGTDTGAAAGRANLNGGRYRPRRVR